MNIANLLLLAIFVSVQTFAGVIALLSLLSIFNGLQVAISIFGGFLLYEAIALRLHNKKNPQPKVVESDHEAKHKKAKA